MSSFDTDRSPTLRELYTLFIPLAFSGAFFPVARPVINAALARTESPELALAAYGLPSALPCRWCPRCSACVRSSQRCASTAT